ncbi:hypothetical protein J6590_083378 [Homalodisca vitripennis]|nr:hypothetical protein J6590_083378 [Homalodisca vitripennis]
MGQRSSDKAALYNSPDFLGQVLAGGEGRQPGAAVEYFRTQGSSLGVASPAYLRASNATLLITGSRRQCLPSPLHRRHHFHYCS